MLRQALFGLSQQRHLHRLATSSALARRVARRFVAGETLEEAMAVVRQLNARGMTATLDHLGENVSSQTEAEAAAGEYRRILQEVARVGAQCNASLKLTHMGLDLGETFAFENTLRVVDEAARLDNFVRVDMESSEYVERTLEIFLRLFERQSSVGVVLQSALFRTAADLERVLEIGARVRLVKGAYLEPPDVAYQRKEEVDASFVRLMQQLLSRGVYPAVASHDEQMIRATRDYAEEKGIDRSRFEFQMLYGIRRDLQTELTRQGYNVRIYVPYGTAWYPYLMRRLAERPANVMFLLGNLVREAASRR